MSDDGGVVVMVVMVACVCVCVWCKTRILSVVAPLLHLQAGKEKEGKARVLGTWFWVQVGGMDLQNLQEELT